MLTGDFNAGESNPAITILTETLTDTFRVSNPDATDVGTFHGFTDVIQTEKIDYVFTTPDITTTSAIIHRPRPDGRYLTDHEPVSATLRLTSGSIISTGRRSRPDTSPSRLHA